MKRNPYFQNFCQNTRQLRAKAGISQQAMAALMGIGVGSLRKIEKGILPPRLGIDVVFKIHIAFGIPIKQLFEENK